MRKILNFGHTIGHAIESYFLAIERPIKHGEAIAIGMIAETSISVDKGLLTENKGRLIIDFLNKIFPKMDINEEAITNITQLAFQDKKNVGGRIKAALLSGIGNGIYDIEITESEIEKSLMSY